MSSLDAVAFLSAVIEQALASGERISVSDAIRALGELERLAPARSREAQLAEELAQEAAKLTEADILREDDATLSVLVRRLDASLSDGAQDALANHPEWGLAEPTRLPRTDPSRFCRRPVGCVPRRSIIPTGVGQSPLPIPEPIGSLQAARLVADPSHLPRTAEALRDAIERRARELSDTRPEQIEAAAASLYVRRGLEAAEASANANTALGPETQPQPLSEPLRPPDGLVLEDLGRGFPSRQRRGFGRR